MATIAKHTSKSAERVRLEHLLKDLMVGFIYPAVLGTVLYTGLDTAADSIAAGVQMWRASAPVAVDAVLLLKLLILTVTILFYCCDYLYILFTREFEIRFFAFDLVFLLALYITVYALRIRATQFGFPVVWLISVCYIIFMYLYYRWDVFELDRSSDAERLAYEFVVKWEKVGIGLLVIPLVVGSFWQNHATAAIVLLMILVAVTVAFLAIIWRKSAFHPPYVDAIVSYQQKHVASGPQQAEVPSFQPLTGPATNGRNSQDPE